MTVFGEKMACLPQITFQCTRYLLNSDGQPNITAETRSLTVLKYYNFNVTFLKHGRRHNNKKKLQHNLLSEYITSNQLYSTSTKIIFVPRHRSLKIVFTIFLLRPMSISFVLNKAEFIPLFILIHRLACTGLGYIFHFEYIQKIGFFVQENIYLRLIEFHEKSIRKFFVNRRSFHVSKG